MTEKEKIGRRVRTRLMNSVQRQHNLQKFRRVSAVAAVLLFSLGLLFFQQGSEKDLLTAVDKGKHIVADFTAGYVSYGRDDSVRVADLVEDFAGHPIRVHQEEGMMVVNPIHERLNRDDSVSLYVRKGGFYKVVLADGSRVYLNSNSKVVYKGDFMENRRVYVEGEAFFEVEKHEKNGERQPFVVETSGQRIEVLGTSFSIRSRSGLLEETVLVEGRVRLNALARRETKDLTPGTKASVGRNGNVKIEPVEIELYTAWKEGFFYYENKPLRDILADLSNYYDIRFLKTEVPDLRFTLYLDRKLPFSEVISLIEKSSNITVDLDNKKLKFSTKSL